MENAVGMETVLFGGPPEIGNALKLANSQIGFMTIFAHPLFHDVTDIIPAMGFAPAEIITNKRVWHAKIEQEKRREELRHDSDLGDGGAVSPRSQSPVASHRRQLFGHQQAGDEREVTSYFPPSPLRNVTESPSPHESSEQSGPRNELHLQTGSETNPRERGPSSLGAPLVTATAGNAPVAGSGTSPTSRRSSGAFSGGNRNMKPHTPPLQTRRPSNTVPTSQLQLAESDPSIGSTVMPGTCENEAPQQAAQHNGTDEREANASEPSTSLDSDTSGFGGNSRQYQSSTSASSPFSLPNLPYRPSEPIRTVRPPTHSQIAFCGNRASVPSLTNTNFDGTSMATSGATSASTTDVGTRATMGALSPSTEATSVVSGGSDAGRPSEHTEDNLSGHDGEPDFEARRSRAASAPTKFPLFMSRGSRESSKQDVRTTIRGQESLNGDMIAKGRAMPRRRSRIRLAFWKRRGESED